MDDAGLGLGLNAILERQKAANLRDGPPSAKIRIDRIDRCIALLVDHRREIEDALDADFGARSKVSSAFADIAGTIGSLKHAKAHTASWMRTQKRSTTPSILGLFGAKAELRYQPKGVVGLISPWNFPFNLTFAPMAGILAAGNRAMIKPSEITPASSALLKTMVAKAFSDEEIAVVLGGADVGQAFTALAFDHMIFTGATSIGRHVMRAAAENLVPVTLELGGKSPVIVGKGADIALAATRVLNGKTLNAGQICLASDYVLAPRDKVDSFVREATAAASKMFPTIRDNPDYTAVVNDRHYQRLQSYLADARAKGAEIIEINPAGEDLTQQPHRRIAPTLVLNPTDDMKIMQEEIFGPLLPIKAYDRIEEAVGYVNAHDRPLGLYYFGQDEAEREHVLDNTHSGGVSVNDVIMHIAQENLPFGGVGPAGMGSYHGHEGFLEFSHKRSVFHQLKKDIGPLAMLRPPYGDGIVKYLAGQITK